jgi:hypothetical protein
VVDAFLAASREGNFDTLLAVLDPDVVFRADRTAVSAGASGEVCGAPLVVRLFSGRAKAARPALVNGAVGGVVARGGRLFLVLRLTIRHGKIPESRRLPTPRTSTSCAFRSLTTDEPTEIDLLHIRMGSQWQTRILGLQFLHQHVFRLLDPAFCQFYFFVSVNCEM